MISFPSWKSIDDVEEVAGERVQCDVVRADRDAAEGLGRGPLAMDEGVVNEFGADDAVG